MMLSRAKSYWIVFCLWKKQSNITASTSLTWINVLFFLFCASFCCLLSKQLPLNDCDKTGKKPLRLLYCSYSQSPPPPHISSRLRKTNNIQNCIFLLIFRTSSLHVISPNMHIKAQRKNEQKWAHFIFYALGRCTPLFCSISL